jgi:hypothetical protein
VLPRGWDYICYADLGGNYAGYAQWWSTGGSWVGIDISMANQSAEAFLYIVAHEFCHARAFEGLEGYNGTDEIATDYCAIRYGFPPPPGWGYI